MSSILNSNIEDRLVTMDFYIYWKTDFIDKICKYIYDHPLYKKQLVPVQDFFSSPIDITNIDVPDGFLDWIDGEYAWVQRLMDDNKQSVYHIFVILRKDVSRFKARFIELYSDENC